MQRVQVSVDLLNSSWKLRTPFDGDSKSRNLVDIIRLKYLFSLLLNKKRKKVLYNPLYVEI